ncbi:hypothetical protein [Streptomyces sp. NPDC021224]|uniref:hypothetical protein n=1 Tax=unclassified Streptomyces TaxID=2593676 RepID=UPI00379A01E7
MNHDTETLMFGATDRVQQAILDREAPAIAVLQGDRLLVMSDYDYHRDRDTAATFERRAAAQAQEIHAVRFVFAVPQIWEPTKSGINAGPVSNTPLREGEQEVIAWLAYDTTDGVDYGHVPYTRRRNGAPVFDDPEVFTNPVRPYDRYPGWLLLRLLLEADDGLLGN